VAVPDLEHDGYCVLSGVIPPDAVARAREGLDGIFAAEAPVAEERGWSNDRYRVAYALPAKDPFFVEFCAQDVLLDLARSALGSEAVVASCNGLAMTPGGRAQRLHIDQEESVAGPAVYLHAVCALDDFDEGNGATRIVPGSHRIIHDPNDAERLEERAVPVTAPAGSVIAYDGRLWHAGSANRDGRSRRAIHAFYARAWARPHWDFPRTIPGEISEAMSPERRRLFGYDATPRRFDVAGCRIVTPHRGVVD